MTWSKAGPKRCRQGGFTLSEVLVGLTIFAVGLVGVAGLTTQVVRILGEARFVEEVTMRTEQVADSLRWFGWGGPGETEGPAGSEIRWEAGQGGNGLVKIRVLREDGRELGAHRVHLVVPGPSSSE